MITFGIDFGTTNSAAVKLAPHAEPERYGDEAGGPYPSIVAIDRATGEAIGGRRVWEQREHYVESGNYHVIQSVKWLLGKQQAWQTEERLWTPKDVASFILTQLSRRAASLGVDDIGRAAITIPVGFPPESRADLRAAAECAGIQMSTFVTESTAAFIRYLPVLRHCRHVAVFDWGGGTLDISILQLRDGTVTELATEGMEIAGDELDLDLARAVHARVMEQRQTPHAFETMPSADRDTLRTKCEYAKRELSRAFSADILMSSYGGAPLHVEVTTGWFESVVSPHVDLAIERLTAAVESARLSFDAIDRLLLVGGSSKLRLLKERLRRDPRYSAALHIAEDAEWDVAHGAAIVEQATGGYELAESLGIILSDNSYYELVSPGARSGGPDRSVVLSLVEDARQANIIIDKRPNLTSPTSERVLAFGVNTLGFNLEELRLRYRITPDMMLQVEAGSESLSPRETIAKQ
jgi:molecular chaperone DnaK